MPIPFNLTPPPTEGTGTAFGAVPGNLGLPDPFGDLSKVAPGLGGVNQNLLTNLTSESLGQISPGTRNALQLAAAQRGVGAGMGPFSGLSTNDLFGNIAGFSEGLQNRAAQQYASLIPTMSGTQTVTPALQTDIANRNATMAAAPNPTAAASYARQLFDDYARMVRGPGGGTGPANNPFNDPFFNAPPVRSSSGAGFPNPTNPVANPNATATQGSVNLDDLWNELMGGANAPQGGTYAPTDVPMAAQGPIDQVAPFDMSNIFG